MGDVTLSCICIVHTAPMNMDMTMTSGMESTPSFDISTNVRRKKIDIRSGMLKTRRMNMQKRPNVAMEL